MEDIRAIIEKEHKNGREDQIRAWIAAIGILIAQASLQSALSPPGGFWPDDQKGHEPGRSILEYQSKRWYQAFIYLNAVTFATSVAVTIMAAITGFPAESMRLRVLQVILALDLLALMGSYGAGACRDNQCTWIVLGIMFFVCVGVALVLDLVITTKLWHKFQLPNQHNENANK